MLWLRPSLNPSRSRSHSLIVPPAYVLWLIIIICIINIIMHTQRAHTLSHTQQQVLGEEVGAVGLSDKRLLANVKNKISTRVGKQNNLINEITFWESCPPGRRKCLILFLFIDWIWFKYLLLNFAILSFHFWEIFSSLWNLLFIRILEHSSKIQQRTVKMSVDGLWY